MRSGRPTKDTRHYWTKDHRFLLYGLALKALIAEPCPTVDKDELVSIGWLHCMRRCHKKELPNAIGNTLRVMKAYIRSEKYRRQFSELIDDISGESHDPDAPQDVEVVLENLQGAGEHDLAGIHSVSDSSGLGNIP